MQRSSVHEAPVLRFGGFQLLPARRQLLLDEAVVPLGSRAFDLLVALVDRRGQLATKNELLREVWPGVVVEESNLATQVAAIRKALALDPALVGSVQTAPGRGYRFVAPVDIRPVDVAPRTRAPTLTVWNGAPDTLSIVVLPLANLTRSVDQDHFVQGVDEAIISDLSRMPEVTVIAAAWGAYPTCEANDVRKVSSALEARYVLKGSVQASEAAIRVNVHLFDGRAGMLVWSDAFTGSGIDRFALQDEIAGRIALSIGRQICVAAANCEPRHSAEPSLSGLIWRGIAADNKPQSLQCLREQERLFGMVVERDRSNGGAHARLARAILLQSVQAHVPADCMRTNLQRGAEAAETALALAPLNARAHLAMSYLHMLHGDFERCAQSSERAIALDRTLAMARNMLATPLAHLGQGDQAVQQAELALRLDPAGPQFDVFATTLGLSRFVLQDIVGATACFSRARTANPRLARAHAWYAIAAASSGDIQHARNAAADLLRVMPAYRLSKSVDGCSEATPARYRTFYEENIRPNARLAGVPI